MPKSFGKSTTLLLLVGLVGVIAVVDDRWVRVGVAILPILALARVALLAGERRQGDADASARAARVEADRRSDDKVRSQIQELLALIREFYTTCHMVAVGQLEPSKAKAKAQVVETKLSGMMSAMLETITASGHDQ